MKKHLKSMSQIESRKKFFFEKIIPPSFVNLGMLFHVVPLVWSENVPIHGKIGLNLSHLCEKWLKINKRPYNGRKMADS